VIVAGDFFSPENNNPKQKYNHHHES